MARKPNYRFDRMERNRAKLAKKEEKLQQKQERAAQRKTESTLPSGTGNDEQA